MCVLIRKNLVERNLIKPIKYFKKALELDSTRYNAMKGIGLLYTRWGKAEKAIEYFEKYLEEFPDDLEVKDNLAIARSMTKK